MAEFVEFRCEEWVPELEKLEKIRLFESKEIKSLVTRRRELEYKLERKTKCKEDFLKYIQFEVDLLKIITARRKKTGINSNKGEIESKQINRVIRLFKQIIFRFPEDVKLWMSLFQFCNDAKQNTVISKMLVRMLQYHTDKPELWIYASNWELKEGKSIENARQYLMKALRHHSDSEKLYLELFKLELNHMKKKMRLKEVKLKKNKWNSDEVSENIIEGKVALVVYKSAIKAIQTADFKVDLLNIVKEYDGADSIQDIIIKDLMDHHPDDEITWDTIAKREYEGLKTDYNELFQIRDATDNDISNCKKKENVIMKKRIEKCVSVYEKAVKRLNTSIMWSYYLDQVVQIYWRNYQNSKYPLGESQLLRNAMEGALAAGHLSEDHLLNWVDILKKSNAKNAYLEEILSKGTEIFGKSLNLWHARIRYHLAYDEEKEGKECFEKAIGQVDEAVSLWELMIEYFHLKKSPEIEEIFRKGLEKGGDVAQVLKPKYLEWLATNKGLDEARKAFETMEFKHPPCLELYRVMIELESKETQCNVERIRHCHELATSNFGQNNTKVWLDFIEWEMKRGDVTNVHKLHRRAINSLSPEKSDEFLMEYNFIKTNTSTRSSLLV